MSNPSTPITRLQRLVLYGALICLGYTASLFLTYSFTVMPGLAALDDRAFVAAFQGLESRFQGDGSQYGNLPLLIGLPGAVAFAIAAAVQFRDTSHRIWLFAVPLVLGLGIVTTLRFNLPSNLVLFAAGDPNVIDVTAVRRTFDEARWTFWNNIRAATSTLAFGIVAYVLHRTSTASTTKTAGAPA